VNEYVAQRLPEVAPDVAHGRMIVAHLGSGASLIGQYDPDLLIGGQGSDTLRRQG
jgi:hypothetical protein